MANQTAGPGLVTIGKTPVPMARTRFFVIMSGAMLGIIVIGFAPTFFLRGLFDVPLIPVYVYIHGVLLTTWYVLVVTQTALIRSGKEAIHRRLGIVTVCVGVGVVVVSILVNFRFVDRLMHTPTEHDVNLSVMLGFGSGRPLLSLAATAWWGNLASLVTFTVLLTCAVLMRRRGDVHKRFMIFASLSILPPGDRPYFTLAGSRRGSGIPGTRRDAAVSLRDDRLRLLFPPAHTLGNPYRCRSACTGYHRGRCAGRIRSRARGAETALSDPSVNTY